MTTRYWVGGTGTWGNNAHWSTSSGGSGGATLPAETDDAIFDANSFTSSGQIVYIDLYSFIGSVTCTGVTNTPTFTQGHPHASLFLSGGTTSFDADIILDTNLGVHITTSWQFAPVMLKSGGHKLNSVSVNALLDDLECTSLEIVGDFDSNDYDITTDKLQISGGPNSNVSLGSSHITINSVKTDSTPGIFILWVAPGFSMDFGTAVVTIPAYDPYYNNIQIRSSGAIGNFTLTGTNWQLICPSGLIEASHATIINSHASGGACFNAFETDSEYYISNYCIDGGGNSGWGFDHDKKYWVGNSGSTDERSHWSSSSGGGGGAQLPYPGIDDNIFDENSFTLPDQIVIAGNFGANLDFTGVTNRPTYHISILNAGFKDITLVSDMIFINDTRISCSGTLTSCGHNMGEVRCSRAIGNVNATIWSPNGLVCEDIIVNADIAQINQAGNEDRNIVGCTINAASVDIRSVSGTGKLCFDDSTFNVSTSLASISRSIIYPIEIKGDEPWYIVAPSSAVINVVNTSLNNSHASGGANFIASTNNGNIDNGDNTGWQFIYQDVEVKPTEKIIAPMGFFKVPFGSKGWTVLIDMNFKRLNSINLFVDGIGDVQINQALEDRDILIWNSSTSKWVVTHYYDYFESTTTTTTEP